MGAQDLDQARFDCAATLGSDQSPWIAKTAFASAICSKSGADHCMPINEDCNQRFNEIEKTLYGAQAQWRELVESINEGETKFLEARLDNWKQWFGLVQEDLSSWHDGGIRCTVRGRSKKLLVKPLEDRMRKRVDFEYVPQ